MPKEIYFRKRWLDDDYAGDPYFTVTEVNYQLRCNCWTWRREGKCNHTLTVIKEEMAIDNQIIKVPSLRETIEAAQLAFYGYVPHWNKKAVKL